MSNFANAKIHSVVIASSYRKFLPEVKIAIDIFNQHHIDVLAPKIGKIKNENSEFVIIDAENDEGMTPRQIEDNFLNAIKKSDILYVIDVDGYIGLAASMEIGYAYALNKPIYCSEEPKDFQHKMFCNVKKISDI